MSFHLPLELLVTIFLWATTPSPESKSPYNTLVLLSQVCSEWRWIVVRTPTLWSNIYATYSIHVIDTFLRRSQGAGIRLLSLGGSDERPINLRAVSRALTNQVHRLTSIDVVIHASHCSLITRNLCYDAPALVSFKLRTIGHPIKEPRSLHEGIFAGKRPPNLRYLALDGFTVPWGSPLLRHLSTLLLSQSCGFMCRPSYPSFISVLDNLALLEDLSLTGCLPLAMPRASGVVIKFPQLRQLYLYDDIASVEGLFDIVELPVLETLTVYGELYDADPLTLCKQIAVLLGPLLQVTPIDNVQFSITPRPQRACVGAGVRLRSSKADSPSPILRMTLITRAEHSVTPPETVIISAIRAFSLEKVVTLHCHFSERTTTPLWTHSLIPRIPRVETLILSNLATESFFTAYQSRLITTGDGLFFYDGAKLPYRDLIAIVGDWPVGPTPQHITEVLSSRKHQGLAVICFDGKGVKWCPRC